MNPLISWKKIVLATVLWSVTNTLFGIDIYWIGGSGKWSDLSHWATSSGGSIRPSAIPGSKDNVIFDDKSFTAPNQTVQIDQQITFCQSLNMATVTQSVDMQGAASGVLNIFGDLKFNDKINFSFLGEVNFSAALPNAQIQMAGNSFQSIVRFKENAGSFQLNGDLLVDSLLVFEGGVFASKGFNISTKYLELYLNSSKTNINFDGSTLTMGGNAFYLPYNNYIETKLPTC